ncbi:hypothetical protein L9W92_03205 [Pelotomaculum terephthalicicum JT]|uniref:hypothetical protein n=1 Tax=Pelotomaculum TaxID=191373 RepID=UPI0009C73DF8|nr:MULTISPECIES: hypothetical protein [Pelotomaculum]MCG9967065.1 hypothetical protein [Pelotomaculum terephthalicicum JT]OPX89252.1 MAG: hypothetical protein A4E54_01027 [Pelotomaculum sp. PtaB.Bin117]OPY63889.1 MAG: hypothetical protein A4E56_00242 [Pelotomaculum sp. PtaU1.Bin065]
MVIAEGVRFQATGKKEAHKTIYRDKQQIACRSAGMPEFKLPAARKQCAGIMEKEICYV